MLIIEIQKSRLMGAIVSLTHLSALAVIILIDIAGWMKLLLLVIVIASFANVVRRVVIRRAHNAITAIEVDSENNMSLIDGIGNSNRVSRLRSVFVNSIVTFATMAVEGKRLPQNLVIPFDAVDKEKFRRLRVALKKF